MKGPFIRFTPIYLKDGRKTKVWAVMTIDGSKCLGRVGWYSPWRRYCFIIRPGAAVCECGDYQTSHDEKGCRVCRYSLAPYDGCTKFRQASEQQFIFEETCLRDIAAFCENQTLMHKRKPIP